MLYILAGTSNTDASAVLSSGLWSYVQIMVFNCIALTSSVRSNLGMHLLSNKITHQQRL